MTRSGLLAVWLLLLGSGASCSHAGSPSNSAGGDSSTGGEDGTPMGTAGKPSEPDPGNSDAGMPGAAAAGAPSDDPGMSDAGAPFQGAAGAAGAAETVETAPPDYPFDVNAAAAVLGGSFDSQREVLTEKTVAYSFQGASAAAVLDRTEWSTASEAEFECSRAANGGTLVVGPDRMLFVTSNADFLSFGTACTSIRVVSGSEYSASLTRTFAQSVFGAP